MKIAVVGSREINKIDIEKYITKEDEIVSGGAKGVDTIAANYAKTYGIKLTEFFPQYKIYGKAAPIIRNKEIVDYADKVIVFWNGESKGALSVIKYAQKTGKQCEVVICK